ncbi:alpha-keto acid decarboxylase family protein [Formicincola oecophyllae]|uniref:Alpha-keto acid decarboxylase family protein n=1 Tax=Formicincola oecophyllae TaxID=2558361 RepID=A0A4Y6UAF3_9PROT|nr:thiamine pyrophosphate-binding protein [Formicincola oecophyllae]QDH14184.1 alpha-keto acid decarboxylase family protein [Formicincola oecophyllae]
MTAATPSHGRISIGQHLINRLHEAGLRRLYGVPGDFNLEFLELLVKDGRISWIGCCNEMNAAYAADGDARLSGFGAVLTTYGVGDLSALQAVAGARAECVPVLSLAGLPPLNAVDNRFPLHHTLLNGDYEDVRAAYRPYTASQGRVEAHNAAEVIDRAITDVFQQKVPAYLQLPCDLCDVTIPTPRTPLALDLPESDPGTLAMVTSALAGKISQARQGIVLVDALVARYGLEEQVMDFITRTGLPYALLPTSRTVLERNHPLYRGIYNGRASVPAAPGFDLDSYVAGADCVVGVGTRLFEFSTGFFSAAIQSGAWCNVEPYGLRHGFATPALGKGKVVTGARMGDILRATAQALPAPKAASGPAPKRTLPPLATDKAAWNGAVFWNRIAHFLRPEDGIFTDMGTCSANLAAVDLPEGARFNIQTIWAAIGYATPAVMGQQMASLGLGEKRRHVLFTGEGAFQLTAQEISTMMRHHLNPVVFVINNRGYTVERCILGEHAPFNDVAPWRYAALPKALGEEGRSQSFEVRDQQELEVALAAAENPSKLTLIEVHLEPLDAPEGLWKMGKAIADMDYSRSV